MFIPPEPVFVEWISKFTKSPHYELIPGMRLINPITGQAYRVSNSLEVKYLTTNEIPIINIDPDLWESAPENLIPDIEDPATVGCLMHMLRKAHKNQGLTIQAEWYDGYHYYIFDTHLRHQLDLGYGLSEGIAIIDAMPTLKTDINT